MLSQAPPLSRGASFLSLAPTTSASYPATPKSPTPAQEAALSEQQIASTDAAVASIATVPSADEVAERLKIRRSSSSGSDSSSKRGFLKLGPVHFGKGNGDWSEDVLA